MFHPDARANASLDFPSNLYRHNSVPAAHTPQPKPSIFYSFVFIIF
jgi:hypothetical protein